MIGLASSNEDDRPAQAGDWLARLQRDDLSEADVLAFDEWLTASPANAQAYDAALAAWTAFDGVGPAVLAELAAADRRGVKSGARPDFARRWMIGAGGAVAAAALAIAILPGVLMGPGAETFATGKGEHRTVALADGSTVDLNAETRLSVTLARHERRVEMGPGEAIFDVAADTGRPFTIHAGEHTVRVVGTQFNVRNREDGLAVTVSRGIVEVRPTDAATGGKAYVLRPGQKLDLRDDGSAKLSAVTPQEALSWRAGRLIYRGEPLATVVADLNREFAAPIQIADADLAAMPVSGVLVVDSQPQVIERLTLMFPLTAVPSGRNVLLRRK